MRFKVASPVISWCCLSPAAQYAARMPTEPTTVLVIEDDATIAMLLRFLLERQGWQVRSVRREQNVRADELVNQALDGRAG